MAIYRCTIQGHLPDGEIWNTTLHIDHTAGAGGALLTAISTGITKMWQGPPTPANSIQQLVPTTVGIDQYTLDELDNRGKNVNQFVTSLPLVGTNTSEMLPHEVSVAVSTRTASPTRSGRGRSFLCPFGVDQIVGGLLDSTAQGQVVRAYASMLTEINTVAVGGVGVYHKFLVSTTKITSVDVGNVPDVQRRRRNAFPETRLSLAV